MLSDPHIIGTLKTLGIYITQNRIAVLKVLMECTGAISVASIKNLSPVKLDRVSIYRTLKAFLEKGLILIVPNSNGIPHYIMKAEGHESPGNGTAFFICTHCGCSESLKDPVTIAHHPDHHYLVKNSYLVLEGVCVNCR